MSIRTKIQEKKNRIRAIVLRWTVARTKRRLAKRLRSISKSTDRQAISRINSKPAKNIVFLCAVGLSAVLCLLPLNAHAQTNSSVTFYVGGSSIGRINRSANVVAQQVTGLRTYEPNAYSIPISNFSGMSAGTTYNSAVSTLNLTTLNLQPHSNKIAFSVGAYYIPDFASTGSLTQNSYSITMGNWSARFSQNGSSFSQIYNELQVMSGYAVEGFIRGVSNNVVPVTYVAYQFVINIPDRYINDSDSGTIPLYIRLNWEINFTSWISEPLPGSIVFCFADPHDYNDPTEENLGYFEQKFAEYIDEQQLQENAEAAATAGQLVSDMSTAAIMDQRELASFNAITTPLFTFAPIVTMLAVTVPVVLLLWAIRKGTS